jgi:hypothetical protein
MNRVVRKGCQEEERHIKYEVAPAFNRARRDALVQGYKKYLSNADADTLIRFYQSDAGHKYVKFQGQPAAVIANGMKRIVVGGAEQSGAKTTDKETLERRIELLQMSTIFASLGALADDERRAAHDASGAPAIGIMMRMTVATQGDELDELYREYSENLVKFSEFLSSPEEVIELRVLGEANSAASEISARYAASVTPELNGDLKRWREIYHSLPQNNPQAPAQ